MIRAITKVARICNVGVQFDVSRADDDAWSNVCALFCVHIFLVDQQILRVSSR